MARRRIRTEAPDALVALTIRVHPDARRHLKSSAALEDMTMEEKSRSILYREIGLTHLPIVVEAAGAAS